MKKLLLSSLFVALIAGVVITEINADMPRDRDDRYSRRGRDRQIESGRNYRYGTE